METIITTYDNLLAQYRAKVMDKMSKLDWCSFKEGLFSEYGIEDDPLTAHKAFAYMLSMVGQPLSESLIEELHQRCTGDHEELIARVPKLLAATQEAMDKRETHPVTIAARFHCYFEFLHPFRDGNGRTGRLMANWILLTMGHPMIIIPQEDKSEYIRALELYRKEHTTEFIEHFFFSVAINRMKHEIEEKARLTARSKLRFMF